MRDRPTSAINLKHAPQTASTQAITGEEPAAKPLPGEGEDSEELVHGDRTTHSLPESSKDIISGKSGFHPLSENSEGIVGGGGRTTHPLPEGSEEVVRDHRALELQKLDEIRAAIQDLTKAVKKSIQLRPCSISGNNDGEVSMQGVIGGCNDMEVDAGGKQEAAAKELAVPGAPVSTTRCAYLEVNVTVRFGK